MSDENYSKKNSQSQERLQLELTLLEQKTYIEQLETENRMLFATVCAFWLRSTRAGVDDHIDRLLVEEARK